MQASSFYLGTDGSLFYASGSNPCTIDNYLFEFYPNGKLCIRKEILAP
jgi:hypothetical protein